MKLNCTLEERISKKTGNPYYVLVIKITDTYEIIKFLDKSEVELIRLTNK